MKFDPELMREILFDAENIPAGLAVNGFIFDGRDPAEVARHAQILINDGYLEAIQAAKAAAKGKETGANAER